MGVTARCKPKNDKAALTAACVAEADLTAACVAEADLTAACVAEADLMAACVTPPGRRQAASAGR